MKQLQRGRARAGAEFAWLVQRGLEAEGVLQRGRARAGAELETVGTGQSINVQLQRGRARAGAEFWIAL